MYNDPLFVTGKAYLIYGQILHEVFLLLGLGVADAAGG